MASRESRRQLVLWKFCVQDGEVPSTLQAYTAAVSTEPLSPSLLLQSCGQMTDIEDDECRRLMASGAPARGFRAPAVSRVAVIAGRASTCEC
jgi:Fe2+ or Zn2+ uptake regulation protein